LYHIALHRNGNLSKDSVIRIGSTLYQIKQILLNSDNKEIKNEHKFLRVDNVNRSVGCGLILKRLTDEDTTAIEPASMYVAESEFLNKKLGQIDIDLQSKIDNTDNFYEQMWSKYLCTKNTPGIQVVAPSHIMMDGLLHIISNTSSETSRGPINIERYKIGKIDKKDLFIASKWINNKADENKLLMQKFSVILSYDPSVESLSKEDIELAKAQKVTILHSNVIYKLLDEYDKFISKIDEKLKVIKPETIAFIQIIPRCIFRTSDPMIFGVNVKDGKIAVGNRVYANPELTDLIGMIESIQNNKKSITEANLNQEVCLKINSKKVIGKDFSKDSILWISH